MAAVDFPNTPSLNQVFTSGSRTWIWTGTTWDVVATTTAGLEGMTLISSTVTAAGATSATISGIPQTYKELKLQISFTGSVGGPSSTSLTFNGTTSSYSWGFPTYFGNSGSGSGTPTYNYGFNQAAIVFQGITSGSTFVSIPGYTSTTVNKNLQFFNYSAYMSSTITNGAAYWYQSTPAAITSMGFSFSNVTGSTIYTVNLWGIK